MLELIKDDRILTVEELESQPHAQLLHLQDILPILVSPDSRNVLRVSEECLSDTINEYPLINGIPVLYPAAISKAFIGEGLKLDYYDDPKLQYFLLSQIKQRGEINASSNDLHYQRHLFRMKECVKDCRGMVLDVGCDNVQISAALFNSNCRYLGLDPFRVTASTFKVIGVGEFLPFQNDTFDNVVFNTSLDHILDYYEAVQEAHRVLKKGGLLLISTLIWLQHTSLIKDSVHFHHFRDYEIDGALNAFNFTEVYRRQYSYKDDTHRYGLYLICQK